MFRQFRTIHLFAALSIVALGLVGLRFLSGDVIEVRNDGSERIVGGTLTMGEEQFMFGELQPGNKTIIRVWSSERTDVHVTANTESGRVLSDEIYLPDAFPGTRSIVELQ